MARISGLAVAQVTAGFVVLWSGLRNTSIRDTLTGFAAGKVPAGSPTGAPTIGISPGSGSGGGPGSPAPSAPANVSGNVALGKMMATAYGWGSGAEWNSLYALWERESGWSNTAQNASSGAYGIAQALPPTKMPKAAQPPADGGSSSASSQIAWGLSYIKSTYGDPNAAWAHEQSAGWY